MNGRTKEALRLIAALILQVKADYDSCLVDNKTPGFPEAAYEIEIELHKVVSPLKKLLQQS
jgi:hypothetical protein